MVHYTYILKSDQDGGYYIGVTSNLRKRLRSHNGGHSRATRHRRPLKLIYFETFKNKTGALKRENKLKSYRSKKYIEYLIEQEPVAQPGRAPAF